MKVKRLLTLAAATLFVMPLLTGCSKRHRIEIQSSGCWIATIDRQNSTVFNECGSISFRVAGEIHCVAVTSLVDTGYVRVRIDDGAWIESTAPRGTAEACR